MDVVDFYSGKSIFITGGSGFVGKVLIEKLLYTCKDLNKIFVLMRNKMDSKPEDRIQQMVNKPLFSRLKTERPEALKKIVPIPGDMSQPDLGISNTDMKLLIDNVSLVFHVAATLKMTEKLEVAMNINVEGTKSVLDLCHRLKNIMVFVYVSTAYCHPIETEMHEKVYPPHIELDEVLTLMKQPKYDLKDILKSMPNTYTLTKNLGENLIVKNRDKIPTVIFRPTAISPSYKEPLKGWTDSWYGATFLITTAAKGLNRVHFGDSNNILDLIPVDYVCNGLIVAAAKCSGLSGISVYHSSSSSYNPIKLKDIVNNFVNASAKIGLSSLYPTSIYTNKKWILYLLTLVLQTIPAYIADLYLRFTGRQPQYVKLQSRIIYIRHILQYFTNRAWDIKADNIKALYSSLSYSEKNIFPCDASDINWTEYMTVYAEGVKKYLLADKQI